MTRTLGALAAHVAQDVTSLSRCVRLDLLDGTSLGFSDHDRPLTINLGDGALTYSTDTGILPSNIVLSTGFESDNFEITGPLNATVTKAAVMGGRFARARVRLFDVNWRNPAQLYPIMAGDVAGAKIEGGKFVFQVRGFQDRFNQTIGRVISPYCSGDRPTCCVNIAPEIETTVTAVTDTMTFEVAATLTPANMIDGKVTFTSGALLGTRPVEIFAATANTVTLFVPLAEAPQVGDTVTLKEGCNRTREMCRDRFDNVVNFRGFPDLVGNDAYLKLPIPGSTA